VRAWQSGACCIERISVDPTPNVTGSNVLGEISDRRSGFADLDKFSDMLGLLDDQTPVAMKVL
jgi:hypothetical protein